jgi:hypothetical protein
MNKSMNSFYGYVNTPADAGLLIFCSKDTSERVVPVRRRLIAEERAQICSGSVFVFCEQDSGMRRWTDGMRWSKSRVEGQFLVYRRIEPNGGEEEPFKRRRISSSDSTLVPSDSETDKKLDKKSDLKKKKRDRSESPPSGTLCKKTFAISIQGKVSHVVKLN